MISKRTLVSKHIVFALALLATFFVVSIAAADLPVDRIRYLTLKGIGNAHTARLYYEGIFARPPEGKPNDPGLPTLQDWKLAFGFEDQPNPHSYEAQATYYNDGDLGFGRNMNCRLDRDFNFKVNYAACYVSNHGFGPGTPAELSIHAAMFQSQQIATVAMASFRRDGQNPSENDVHFYVYGPDPDGDPSNGDQGKLLSLAQLDGEGEKAVPHLCLPCHGAPMIQTATL